MNPSREWRQRLEKLDRDHVWHPFTAHKHWADEQMGLITSGRGEMLRDADGVECIDGVSSLWTTVHGHNHPALNRAMKDQIDEVSHSTFLGLSHPPAVELAARLVDLVPEGLNRVFYSESGSTAVEIALKMAYQYHCQKADPQPERSLFISLSGAYHGDTLGAVSVGGMELFHDIFRPLLFPTLQTPQPYCYRCPLGLERGSCEAACATGAEEIIAANAHRLAAVIIEPLVQGAAGMITQPKGYLSRLARAASKAGALLIVDEVATGFGRTGTMFACEQEGVTPDLMSLGKGLSGGYLPLAATLATEEIFQAFWDDQWQGKTFFHGHTFTANPVACAAALANLDVFGQEATLDRLANRIDLLTGLLEPLADRPWMGQIRQMGFMVGLEMVADRATKAPLDPLQRLPQKIVLAARRMGAIIRPLGDVMILMPPLSIEPENLIKLVDITDRAMAEVLDG